MSANQLVESPVSQLADTLVGDRVGPLATASEPTLCAVAAGIAAGLSVAAVAAGVTVDAAAADLVGVAVVGATVAAAGAAVAAGGVVPPTVTSV